MPRTTVIDPGSEIMGWNVVAPAAKMPAIQNLIARFNSVSARTQNEYVRDGEKHASLFLNKMYATLQAKLEKAGASVLVELTPGGM